MTEDISQVRVGVLADPGLPATLVNHLRDTLGEPLRGANWMGRRPGAAVLPRRP